MDQFLSTFTNRIDRKGRVSVPAEFRAVLTRRNSASVVLYPSVHYPAIDGSGKDFLVELQKRIETVDPLSQEYDDLIDSVMPFVRVLEPDQDGRVVLPDDLIAHAGLTDTAVFVGRGTSFQIWQPQAWTERGRLARERARAARAGGGAR